MNTHQNKTCENLSEKKMPQKKRFMLWNAKKVFFALFLNDKKSNNYCLGFGYWNVFLNY